MILDIIKGFYPYFGVLAVLGIIIRIRNKSWTRAETILLGIIVGHAVLMLLQVRFFSEGWKMSRRYLLPVAPLAFGWSAYSVILLMKNFRSAKYFLPLIALLLGYDALVPALKSYCRPKKNRERVVVEIFSETIRNDYRGAPFTSPSLSDYEYRSPALPAVLSNFPALGYYAGGHSLQPYAKQEEVPDYIVCTGDDNPGGNKKLIQMVRIGNFDYQLWKVK